MKTFHSACADCYGTCSNTLQVIKQEIPHPGNSCQLPRRKTEGRVRRPPFKCLVSTAAVFLFMGTPGTAKWKRVRTFPYPVRIGVRGCKRLPESLTGSAGTWRLDAAFVAPKRQIPVFMTALSQGDGETKASINKD